MSRHHKMTQDLMPLEEVAEAQIAVKKIMADWPKDRVMEEVKTRTPLKFGELVYDIQSSYEGKDKRYFCAMVHAHFFMKFMDILEEV